MKQTHYHEHKQKRYELKRLKPETTAPQPDKYFCRECGNFYAEEYGDATSNGVRLVLIGFAVKDTSGAS